MLSNMEALENINIESVSMLQLQEEEADILKDDSIVSEENTILLPEPISAETNGLISADEPAIALHSDQEILQEDQDVLAEPLDTDHLIETTIQVNAIEKIDIIAEDEVKKNRRGRKAAYTVEPDPIEDTPSRVMRSRPSKTPTSEIEAVLKPKKDMKSAKKTKVEEKEQPRNLRAADKSTKVNAKSTPPRKIKPKEDERPSGKKGESIEENQCRICLSKKDLVSIFKREDFQTVADKFMTICPNVKIMKKDFLPQFVCNACVQSVSIAVNLKNLCETTDKDLRSRLSRSKNKIRRPPTGYVLVDAAAESEVSEIEEKAEDDDFKISNESGVSPSDSGSDEDFDSNRRRSKRVRRKKSTGSKRRRGKSTPRSQAGSAKKPKKSLDISKTMEDDAVSDEKIEDFSTGSEDNFSPTKKRNSRSRIKRDEGDKTSAKTEHSCAFCAETFTSAAALQKHKKTHSNDTLNCEICGKTFKLIGSYKAHVAKHKEETDLKCEKCDKFFPNKTERKKHLVEVHNETSATFSCEKCKKSFTSQLRLDTHKETKCPGFEVPTPLKRNKVELDALTLGKDLFKCVAPLTTTYWSDSFSE